MDNKLRRKLASIPEENPDAEDIRMINEAAQINDGSTIPLDGFIESLQGYSGKVLLRLPKSLHKRLAEEARAEGVSLNQYALYKLGR